MTSSSDAARTTTLLRGSDQPVRPATFGRQFAPAGGVGVGDPAEWLAGRDAGYDAGRADAAREQEAWLAAAKARDAAEREERALAVGRVLAGLDRAVAAAAQDLTVDDLLATATRFAVDLAEELVGHHLEVADCAARDALARAVREVPRGSTGVVRLHPDDLALLVPSADDISSLVPGSHVEVLADPSVGRGGCVVDLGDRSVDARLVTALARVREVLGR